MELIVSTLAFVKELGDFSYELSALDRVWDILFPDKGERLTPFCSHSVIRKIFRAIYAVSTA